MSTKDVVLAFSGGLDTSFCIPWLLDRGYRVTTLFVDTGGVDEAECAYIEQRATDLGAVKHITYDASQDLWDQVVKPLVRTGAFYQNQYPVLCSDRYLIVDRSLALARDLGTNRFAHGCTAMGNDQVRFDLTARALMDNVDIIAPIRELQASDVDVPVRDYEMDYLRERGVDVRAKTSVYTINENVLGVTTSGSEVDEFDEPGPDTFVLTRPRAEWPADPLKVTIGFEKGEAVSLDGEALAGPEILTKLNAAFGAYGVGRGIYTGDTTIGIKGRIVFEAPGITALTTAHNALEEAVLSMQQNRFKSQVSQKWIDLAYRGLFYEPLMADLQAFLESSQQFVTGSVTLRTDGAQCFAVAIDSEHLLVGEDAVYAQSADWTSTEAEGFIKLFGKSTVTSTRINKR